MIGTTLSHYKIIQKLGEGGMGVVYKAQDMSLDRTVALKFISAAAGASASLKERLAREAKACAALQHPNITIVYDLAVDGGNEFIVMEFVEGKSLDKILEEREFDVAEALSYVLQLLDGVEAAHRKGIVHRDLKASNIMIDAEGVLKIMDFGLAKLAQMSTLTQSRATVGTAAYMSPEQARGEETDHRSDIYSAGVVFYQLLTRSIPFPHAHSLAVLYSVVNEEPRPPRELNPSIPAAVEAIVLKAMAKKPEERFDSCAEMARSLLEATRGLPGAESYRKRYWHLLEGASSVSTAPADAQQEKYLWNSKYSRFGMPALLIILLLAYALVKLQPSFFGGGSAAPEQARALARKHNDSAAVLMQANRADLALEELGKAVDADSTFGAGWANLAVINMRAQRTGVAEKQLRKAMVLDKGAAHIYCYNIAYVCEERGSVEEAMAWYSESIAADSSFAPAYCAVANLHVQSDRPNDAIRLLVRFSRLNPEAPDQWQVDRSFGKAYIALKNYTRAREVLEESNRLRPGDPRTIVLLASVYDALRMDRESLAAWRELASAANDSATVARANLRIKELTEKIN